MTLPFFTVGFRHPCRQLLGDFPPAVGSRLSTQMRTWLLSVFPQKSMKHLFFWRKKHHPSWMNEFHYQGFRALVGIAFNEVGGIHHVIKLQQRNDKGKYKDVEVFRNYEWPTIAHLFRNIEEEAKSLVAA